MKAMDPIKMALAMSAILLSTSLARGDEGGPGDDSKGKKDEAGEQHRGRPGFGAWGGRFGASRTSARP